MAPRTSVRPERELDLSNVGKAGRRTGVTLAPRRVDEYGLEEVSGIFSSPHKQSPAKQLQNLEAVPESETPRSSRKGTRTPTQAESTKQRRSRGTSIPPPRSASPRKSGITGSARRSNLTRVQDESPDKENELAKSERPKSRTPLQQPPLRPLTQRPASVRRFSPDRTPLRNRVLNGRAKSAHVARQSYSLADAEQLDENVQDETPSRITLRDEASLIDPALDLPADDYEPFALGNEQEEELQIPRAAEEHDESLLPVQASVEVDRDDEPSYLEPAKRIQPAARVPTVANSRRKRKSDVVDDDDEAQAISSPAAKKARRVEKAVKPIPVTQSREPSVYQESVHESSVPQPEKPQRKPTKKKTNKSQLSEGQEKDLQQVVERVKARPGPKKSLYVLRRETPADDNVGRTRSGRLTVKPLAWWKNERCVWSNSPAGAGLEDGARFPLNSIKEIIRNEQVEVTPIRKQAKSKKKGKGKARAQSQEVQEELESEDDGTDQNAEPWETEIGTFRGLVSQWDSEYNGPILDEEEVDLAYAPAAIETKEVKNSKFRYAKLLSTKFFGSGIVDLPPGEMKRMKPTQKMHMSFFVAYGRVTVTVAPGDEEGVNLDKASSFSVGKGGFWQVPRGNYYSIENELGKPARMFFSQACEVRGDE